MIPVAIGEVVGCMERLIVTLPRELMESLDAWAERLDEERSRIVSRAVQEWLERQESEALLVEGYREMAEHMTQMVGEIQPLQAQAAEGIWVWDE